MTRIVSLLLHTNLLFRLFMLFDKLELRGATRPNSSSCGEPAVARTQGLASLAGHPMNARAHFYCLAWCTLRALLYAFVFIKTFNHIRPDWL